MNTKPEALNIFKQELNRLPETGQTMVDKLNRAKEISTRRITSIKIEVSNAYCYTTDTPEQAPVRKYLTERIEWCRSVLEHIKSF